MTYDRGNLEDPSNTNAVLGEKGVGSQVQAQVIEDDEDEQKRKALLEQRIQEQGEREARSGSPRTMIDEARKHIGYREGGNNDTKFNRWLGPLRHYPHDGYGYPWCHAFLSYCLWHSGNADVGPRTAACEAGVAWFKSRNRYYSKPRVGDLVYYGARGGTHVELVAAVTERTIRTVGGNTSGSLAGSYFNGNGVYDKTVDRSASEIHGYGRPSYGNPEEAPATPITSIRTVAQQQQAVNGLGYPPVLDVDGEWGPKTEAGVRWLQKKVGTTADGEWGEQTEAKYLAFAAAGQGPGTGTPAPSPSGTGTTPTPGPAHGGITPAPEPSGPATMPMLRMGDVEPAIGVLQEKLNRHGAGLDVDNDFGPATDRAVRTFQRATGLEVDGIVGPATWKRLDGQKLAEWPSASGADTPYIEEITQAAGEIGLPLHHALALVEGESGFRNIFGCDTGPRSTVPFCRQPVTRARFLELLNHVRRGGTSNGVGLTQVTYSGFLPQLEEAGGGEQPLAQCRVGFRILKDHFNRYGERKGYAVYNGGGPNPPNVSWRYADAMLERARRWG